MIGIDSDVLVIHHIFTGDARYGENALFMDKSAEHERGVTIYNLLELCGIVAAAGKPTEARSLCDELVTWNKRHFEGKTNLSVCTPAEWLQKHGHA